jgi:hypothetical protein
MVLPKTLQAHSLSGIDPNFFRIPDDTRSIKLDHQVFRKFGQIQGGKNLKKPPSMTILRDYHVKINIGATFIGGFPYG